MFRFPSPDRPIFFEKSKKKGSPTLNKPFSIIGDPLFTIYSICVVYTNWQLFTSVSVNGGEYLPRRFAAP